MKRIFAALAGALALIVVPPTGSAERQLPIVLDLSAPHAAEVVLPTRIAFVWPLSPQ